MSLEQQAALLWAVIVRGWHEVVLVLFLAGLAYPLARAYWNRQG